ncbi:methyltransferase [Streptomyces sp. ISL-98]|uniref:methyltransferase domain-containing protein n=1 Tax=Streptomyces sp. ISL-98 TaxID=2819192 RepID=UPI001BED0310|nr:methyltransferase domain-containing protein [Streptomyces sp. ISL-98]MBT2508617.1 methyltransferase [Streptomyces sp. ISL-98]
MGSTAQVHPQHAELVELLAEQGLVSERWREVWERVPRHLFIPPTIWRQGPERCEPVTTDAEWWQLVYSDEPVVTQIDDGAANGPGVATSSNSQPSMVATMLQHLKVEDGHRVLEIGTATGHVAALLSERLGDELIFSVEIDPPLAHEARENLATLGYAPTVVVADGEHGWAEAAPYDRLIATCALRRVPYELVRQVKPGGILVAPMAGEFWSGAIVQLSIQEGGIASGPFRGGASYMPMRSHRAPADAQVQGNARPTESKLDPRLLLTVGFSIYAGARMPGVSMVHAEHDGTTGVWLMDQAGSGAFAEPGEQAWQYGERDLWWDVETTYQEYEALGSPDADAFGLTVTPRGQDVWLTHPRRVIASA